MPLFDLDELPELLDPFPLWSAGGRRPRGFAAPTTSATPSRPISEAARELVAAERGGRGPRGR